MSIKRKGSGLSFAGKRAMTGRLYILPWFIGFICFFLIPFIEGVVYTVNKLSFGENGVNLSFVGTANYKKLFSDLDFLKVLSSSLAGMFPRVLIIVFFSLFVALILRGEYKGRTLARAIFFLPVIISSGVVMYVLNGGGGSSAATISSALGDGASAGAYVTPIDFSGLLSRLNFPSDVNNLLMGYLSDTFNLIWSCGVQIVLYIAGLQTVPVQLYEVGRVEGATAWESFWYITFPMLGRVTLLVVFYTMVELFVENSELVDSALQDMRWHTIYDSTSAQLWIYFICVGIIIGIVMLLYNKLLLKRWN